MIHVGSATLFVNLKKSLPSFLLVIFCIISILGPATAQNVTSGRPILFTHGFYGDSPGWGNPKDPASFRGFVITSLAGFDNTDYGSNTSNYDLYFDLQTGSVLWDKFGNPAKDPPAVGNVPTNARFFTIVFNSWNASRWVSASLTQPLQIVVSGWF